MKRSRERPDIEREEQEITETLRAVTAGYGKNPEPNSPYWDDLIVRTNKRLDEATSARAISVSWAARVALPGIVSIIFFFVGLHYYIPERSNEPNPISAIVADLSEEVQDSLMDELVRAQVAAYDADRYDEIFEIPEDEILSYLLTTEGEGEMFEALSEAEASELLSSMHRTIQRLEEKP